MNFDTRGYDQFRPKEPSMNEEHEFDEGRGDDLELSGAELEGLLSQFGEGLRSDVDLDRLHEAVRNAMGSHPDRETIIDMMNRGAHFFVKPTGDDLELSVGYFDNPALNPPDAPHGHTQPLGLIPLELVLRRPQG
jgi:hypothetical protein